MNDESSAPMRDSSSAPPRRKPKGRRRAIRLHCIDCTGGSYADVKNCTAGDTCSLFPWRFAKKAGSRVNLIARFCRDCMGGQQGAAQDCLSPNCALFQYRCHKIKPEPPP